MKLYLSSFRIGDNPQELPNLFGKNKKVAVIPNGLDVITDVVEKEEWIKREKDDLLKLGLLPKVVDLKDYFGKEEEFKNKISEYGGVWVLGGNVFVLRRAYQETGMDNWLLENRRDKEFVYAGYSAGICVLSPNLKGLEMVDSPGNVPEGYKSETIWKGVGLINFSIAPHYMSNHSESEAVNKEVEYYKQQRIECRTLRDGEIIVMDSEI